MESESLCPSVDVIASYVGGRPMEGGLDALESHLDACSACARVVIETAGAHRTGSDRPAYARPRIFQPGQLIAGRYEVVAFLGAGGMGEVYEVQDRELGERVALKTVGAAISLDPAAVVRFKAEAQLGRKVTHRNVCRVFDLGIDVDATSAGGPPVATPFLTMELIRGRALSDHIRAGDRFSADEVVGIARAIARGLEAAHEAGVLHRDLKCDNVLLAPRSPRGFRPVITDFGLAAAVTSTGAIGRPWSSRTPPLYGTRPYVAPERLTGAADTSATDIYSLGVVMFELAAGSLLARGPLPATFDALETATPLGAVIRRCLEANPQRRPTAADVLAALEGESAIVTERIGSRSHRRRKWWSLGAAAASVALATSLIWAGKERAPAASAVVLSAPSADHATAPSRAAAASPAAASPAAASSLGPAPVRSPGPPPASKRRARQALPQVSPRPVEDADRDETRHLLESAEARLRAGRIEEACVEGRAAARHAPASSAAWEFLGRCYMRLGEPAEARDCYRRYLQLAPTGTNAVFIRAIVEEQDT
jgi:hypothetical protein